MYTRRSLLNMPIFVMIAYLIASATTPVAAQTVATRDEISRAIAIQNLAVMENAVSGEVINRSPHRMRDVEVLIQYHWLWKNEFDPGENPPGRAVYITLKEEIPPGMSVPFSYTPRPLLQSTKEGRFMHEVSVAGFTVVVMPQTLSAR